MPTASTKENETQKLSPIVVTAAEDGQRLDKWLRAHFINVSKIMIEKLCRTGQLRVDGLRVRPNIRVRTNQKIRVPDFIRSETSKNHSIPAKISQKLLEDLQKSLIFDDEHFIIFNKPAGMAVQGGSKLGHFHLVNALPQFSLPGNPVPKLVHRLDKETSGVLIVAKTPKSARIISEMIKYRKVKKIYWAIVHNSPENQKGLIFSPTFSDNNQESSELGFFEKNENCRGFQLLILEKEEREALSTYRVLSQIGKESSWLELMAITGRKHQLRKHMVSIGCPIVGDKKYGLNSKVNFSDNDCSNFNSSRQKLQLHARLVEFDHPFTGKKIKVKADPPFHMAKKLELFRSKEA
tara:strand:+ start:44 stop:1096 length:1053 start_codon:yes stop_codon:yes gene_type:complete